MNKEIIERNWETIRKYVKENYHFQNDYQFRWKHEVYGFTEFGVTKNGDAFFCTGSHGWGVSDWYYHPDHKMGYEGKRLTVMETIERDWQMIKTALDTEQNTENNLIDFHI